jgi:hypothetical protein
MLPLDYSFLLSGARCPRSTHATIEQRRGTNGPVIWMASEVLRELEELLPETLIVLTLRDDYLAFCSWSRPSSRERRIALIGRYIRSRKSHAPRLRSLKVRLTSAKECLRDAVQKLTLSVDEHEGKTEMLRGTKSETYCWYFETARALSDRPDLGQRIDSMQLSKVTSRS